MISSKALRHRKCVELFALKCICRARLHLITRRLHLIANVNLFASMSKREIDLSAVQRGRVDLEQQSWLFFSNIYVMFVEQNTFKRSHCLSALGAIEKKMENLWLREESLLLHFHYRFEIETKTPRYWIGWFGHKKLRRRKKNLSGAHKRIETSLGLELENWLHKKKTFVKQHGFMAGDHGHEYDGWCGGNYGIVMWSKGYDIWD